MKQTINKRKFKKNLFEKAAWHEGTSICGVDEVGRGCLAGPVVAGAVILPLNTSYKRLKDSKLMTEEERLKAYRWIIKHCRYAIGIKSHQTIDNYNIYQSTLKAMKQAVLNVCSLSNNHPSAIVIDAMPLRLDDTAYKHIPVYAFPKGESWSSSIAAASIVAKVTRDAMMKTLDTVFPGYSFVNNKGYGAKKHKDNIKYEGATIIHRKTFLHNEKKRGKNEQSKQQCLF